MPSPVGHALGGLLVGLVFDRLRSNGQGPDSGRTRDPLRDPGTVGTLGTLTLVACLPDIDFLWGRHSMETHSLGVSVLAGLVAWAITRRADLALACAVAWASHVLFDWLGSDDSPPLGVMALWPFSSEFYFANAFVFDTITRRYWLPGFVMHNVIAVIKEVILLGPPVALLWWWRRKGGSGGPG